MNDAASNTVILDVRDLSVDFRGVPAVRSLSFAVEKGRTLAIVGESGSGKSVTSRAIMRLTDYASGTISGGSVIFQSRAGTVDMMTASSTRLRQIRGAEIAMIFQDPMTSLDPLFTIGDQISEAIVLHQKTTRQQATVLARSMLDKVRIADAAAVLKRYPHELSGGMRQRVMIAMSLSCRPQLLIADEPTTALDVTIQAQILNTIRELQAEMDMAVIFITHDMGVVAEMANDIVVMRHGEKLEQAPVRQLFSEPQHSYTRALLAAVPRLGSMTGQPPPNSDRISDDARRGGPPLVQVDGLTAHFPARKTILGRLTHRVHAVEGISFEIAAGETLALVGESGSGKSTTGRMIQQILNPTAGKIRFKGRDIAEMPAAGRREMLQKIQYIFQDPFAALDPRQRVGDSIAEPIRVHRLLRTKAEIDKRVAELLEQVGLPGDYASRLPHQLSGGQRQRICIGRALACNPELIIADESVSALDVSIQAQILDLLLELQRERGLSYLFITHDMAVVEKISHRVAVMYLGQIVELGTRQEVFETPQHPYTRKLLASIPVPDPDRTIDRKLLTGSIPSAVWPVDKPPARLSYRRLSQSHLVAETAEDRFSFA